MNTPASNRVVGRARPLAQVEPQQRRRGQPPALPPVRTGVPLIDAPGLVFRPTDEDLVVYYLRRFLNGLPLPEWTVVMANVYSTEPWNLLVDGRKEGYFLAHRTRRSVGSKWPSRTAGGGSWQTFAKEEEIKSAVDGRGHVTVGIKNSLAYKLGEKKYVGWVMYEFELFDKENFQEYVLCHIKMTRTWKQESKRHQPDGVAAEASRSMTTMPALKKCNRYQEQQVRGSISPFLSSYNSSVAASATVVPPPPPPQEQRQQIVASSCCNPVETTTPAPPPMFESFVDKEGNLIFVEIDDESLPSVHNSCDPAEKATSAPLGSCQKQHPQQQQQQQQQQEEEIDDVPSCSGSKAVRHYPVPIIPKKKVAEKHYQYIPTAYHYQHQDGATSTSQQRRQKKGKGKAVRSSSDEEFLAFLKSWGA